MSNFLPMLQCQLLSEVSILNFDFSPTAQYIVVGALLHVFFVVLFLANIIIIIIIIEKKISHLAELTYSV